MPRPRLLTRWLLFLWVTAPLLLLSFLGACGQASPISKEETSGAGLSVQNTETALALTAWPSPPPIITRPPTPSAAPRRVWTASPQPHSTALPTHTPAPTTTLKATEPPLTSPVGSGQRPVRLVIPSLNLDVPVTEVGWDVILDDGTWRSVWQTAEGSAGHHRNSANPGEVGNVVISGHHNTRGQVFRQVSEIGQPGASFDVGDDVILVTQDDERFSYTVIDWARFQEEGVTTEEQQDHATYLDATTEETVTLITCWPYESNTHRVVVVAKRQP